MNRKLKTPKSAYWTLAAGFALGAASLATVYSGNVVPIAIAQTPEAAAPRLASGTTTESMVELRNLNDSFANLAEFAAPALVDIKSVTERRQGANGVRVPIAGGEGSGFIFRSDGYILTNDHVVGGFDRVTVTLRDGREYEGKVIRAQEHDIAVVKIEANNLPTLSFADSNGLRPGEFTMALGAPFGLENTVTIGHVSALHRTERVIEDRVYADLIQTDAAINKGNSGGPLINIDGQVVGVNTAIFSPSGVSAGIGFAIPSNQAKFIADLLIEKGKVSRSFMGVVPETVKEFRRKELNISGGAVVARVQDGTPAAKAGIQQNDIITKIGDRNILSSVDLRNTMIMYPAGTEVEVKYLRSGKESTAKVKLEEAPAAPARSQQPQIQGLPEGFNFEMPEGRAPNMEQFFRDFKEEGNAPKSDDRPRLGVDVMPISEEMRKQFSVPEGAAGVIVAAVSPGSIASTVGMRPGDVITKFGTTEIKRPQDLADAVAACKKGDSKAITYFRYSNDSKRTVTATVTF